VAWLLIHKVWPDEIDHINGVKNDNRLLNLRSVSHRTNMQNTKKPNDNSSGRIGICWDIDHRKWITNHGR